MNNYNCSIDVGTINNAISLWNNNILIDFFIIEIKNEIEFLNKMNFFNFENYNLIILEKQLSKYNFFLDHAKI